MLVHKLINSLYAHCYCQCILFLSKNFVAVPNSLTHHVFLFHMKKHTIRINFKYCLVIWWSFWIFTAFDWSYWTTPTKLSGTLYLRNIITILFMRRKIVLHSLWAVFRGKIVVRQKQNLKKLFSLKWNQHNSILFWLQNLWNRESSSNDFVKLTGSEAQKNSHVPSKSIKYRRFWNMIVNNIYIARKYLIDFIIKKESWSSFAIIYWNYSTLIFKKI